MVAAADLDHAALVDAVAGADHQPARRQVEDAGIAPPRPDAHAGGQNHAPPQLSRLLVYVECCGGHPTVTKADIMFQV
jgi:hypothetical protein